MPPARLRSGMSLVELLLFTAIVAVIGMAIVPVLFLATENRLLQQTASLVEQNGAQVLQQVSFHLRAAERVLDPPLHESGSVLTLQSGSGALDPTMIGINSGALVVIRHTLRQVLSSPQVAIEDFKVRNTSLTASSPSVQVSFRVSRTIRMRAPRTYVRTFEAVFAPFPDHVPMGNPCRCALPGCAGADTYGWQVCEGGMCLTAASPLDCGS